MSEDNSFLNKAADWIGRWSRLARADRPGLLALAGVAFVVGGWLSYTTLDVTWQDISWVPLGLCLLLAVPATTFLNGLEYWALGRMVEVRVPILTSIRVAVTGTAANLLPIPGAALVRTGDLVSRGVTAGLAVRANAIAGLASLFVAGVVATILFTGLSTWGALTALVAAVLSAAGMATLLRRRSNVGLLTLVAIEIGLLAVTAARAWLVAMALGLGNGWMTPLAIACVYPLAAAIGIFPGGLALREFLAALVTRATQAGASAGFLITAVDRLLGLLVHAPIALVLSHTGFQRRVRLGNES